MRLDLFLVENGFARSRARAKEAIDGGFVTVDGKVIKKASFDVAEGADITCETKEKYVSRGGYKLEKAINTFGINLEGAVAVDIGASTGGFTDCMLQNGAKKVYAIDTGHDQLDEKLLCDTRVISFEGCNIRDFDLTKLCDIDFISVDVSFISLTLIFPIISEILTKGQAVCLIKPQFETNNQKGALNKNGIVKDKKLHQKIILNLCEKAMENGLYMEKITSSPIKGGDGNREFLCLLKKEKTNVITEREVKVLCENSEL